jgi:hypothetical protein
MSHPYSTPVRQQQTTWPIFVQTPAQNNARLQATVRVRACLDDFFSARAKPHLYR